MLACAAVEKRRGIAAYCEGERHTVVRPSLRGQAARSIGTQLFYRLRCCFSALRSQRRKRQNREDHAQHQQKSQELSLFFHHVSSLSIYASRFCRRTVLSANSGISNYIKLYSCNSDLSSIICRFVRQICCIVPHSQPNRK